jgi:hypothetical protein
MIIISTAFFIYLRCEYIAVSTTIIFNKLHFPLQGFHGQTGQTEDVGFGLHISPYGQVVLDRGRGRAAIGGAADQTLAQIRGQNCVPPGGDVISVES